MPPILVANCPRCAAEKMTFDVKQIHWFDKQYDRLSAYTHFYELFCICRHCQRSVVFVARQKNVNSETPLKSESFLNSSNSVNSMMNVDRYINLLHNAKIKPPQYTPKNIEAAFCEAATCLAVECWNAAGTMFRQCVDLATKSFLPQEEVPNLNNSQRRNLGSRLKWLFENNHLSSKLRDLSDCIREDGNEAAHVGNLKEEDARNLLEFTTALLEDLYTVPEKLKLAKERQQVTKQIKIV